MDLFKNQTIKLKRAAKLTHIIAKYGFQDLLPHSKQESGKSSNFDQTTTVYERIRMAIEELGPTFVKFAQTLSPREDLFPPELIQEFKKLQDQVPYQEINVSNYIQEMLRIETSDFFSVIDSTPFASASIAQVYKARLKDGTPVLLKIKRPDIQVTIEADLLILKDAVSLLSNYSVAIRQVNLEYILSAFQKTLIEELSFINEAQNIEKFAYHFKNENRLICMRTYPELCNNDILCISEIEGVKITDKATLTSWGLDLHKLVDSGLELFITQVIKHGFFHADPHPGNILVTPAGKLSFIDLGAMGKILSSDQRLLEDFIIAFIQNDADRLIQSIKRMALVIEIQNERSFKREILELLDIINTNTLENIDVKKFFTMFSHLLNQNNIILPDHIYLLVRGIVLIEGIGRTLNPKLNIVEKVKPYIQNIIQERLSAPYLTKEFISRLSDSFQLLNQAPKTFNNMVQLLENGDLKIKVHNTDLEILKREYRKNQSINRYFILGCLFIACGCLVIPIDQYKILSLPILSWIAFFFGVIFLLLAKLRSLRIE